MLEILFNCLRGIDAFIVLLGSYGSFCMSITGEDFFQKEYLKYNINFGVFLLINFALFKFLLLIDRFTIGLDMMIWLFSIYIFGFSLLFSFFIYLLKKTWHKLKLKWQQ